MKILMYLHVLKSSEFENHILALGLCIYLCYENNVKSNYRRNPKFDILHFLSHVNDTLNFFMQIRKVYRGTQKNLKSIRPMNEISC